MNQTNSNICIDSCRLQGSEQHGHSARSLGTSQHSALERFGDARTRVLNAVQSIKSGSGVLLVDDDDRENEGDLIFSAELITEQHMAMLIRECSGIVCLCLTDETIERLQLNPMVTQNTSRYGTAFLESIEAASGVTTGVSAQDRVTTIKAAINPYAKPADLAKPGHVFPLRAHPTGLSSRRGHTEGTIELMRLAGLNPCGVLCELTNANGSMAKLPQIVDFAKRHEFPLLSIEDLVSFQSELTMSETPVI